MAEAAFRDVAEIILGPVGHGRRMAGGKQKSTAICRAKQCRNTHIRQVFENKIFTESHSAPGIQFAATGTEQILYPFNQIFAPILF
jgi:hypothetical protein